MTSYTLSPIWGAGVQLFDNSGNVLTGGKIYTYEAGTTTPAVTYTNSTGSAFNSNPIIANASGRLANEIWLPITGAYKFVLKDANDVLIATYDNIPATPQPAIVNDASSISYEQGYTVTAGAFTVGVTYLITSVGTTNFIAIGAADNITGILFTATGAGSGTGTAKYSRTVQAKLQESVSVKDFGAVGNGVTNDTVAIQNAISSGKDLFFPSGSYLCSNLTQSTNGQCFYANGDVKLIKNANGPILTSSGNNVIFQNIKFYGDAASPVFTGNNLVSSGNSLSLINCGSQWAYGRAILATGSHVQIIGTNAIYQTTDTSATGYDIEIGVSGTATLYHQLFGIYTSQSTGGIKFTDTGSAVISGGQFGKLSILAGTSPTGVNGGVTSNARILGDVVVGLANGVFTGNQFSTQTITINAGTSNTFLDTSNLIPGTTIVNNGNSNSPIIKSIGTGSPTGIILQYGADTINCQIRYAEDLVDLIDADLSLANDNQLLIKNLAGVAQNAITLSSGNDWTIGSNTGAGNFTNIVSGDGGIYFAPDGTSAFQAYTSGFRPQVDGVPSLGTAGQRWSVVYATTGAINTSDANEKTNIVDISDAEKRVAVKLKSSMKRFKFKDGDRYHFGTIAQNVKVAFESEGLVAEEYGVFCYDEWEAKKAVIDEKTGGVTSPATKAGSRMGVRYDELFAFIISAL